MSLGQWLREKREAKGLSQREVAEKATEAGGPHVYQTRVSDWELGNGLPTAPQLKALCEALGADLVEARQKWTDTQFGETQSDAA